MTMDVNFDEVFENVMMNAIIAACDGNGVLDGLAVSENGAGADMSVDVAGGNCLIDGTKYTESSTTNLAISAADATYDRKDLVVYDSSLTAGDPTVITGTAAATPVPPDIPSGDILLAIVNVAAGVTQITNADIVDGIVILRDPYYLTRALDFTGASNLFRRIYYYTGGSDWDYIDYNTTYRRYDFVIGTYARLDLTSSLARFKVNTEPRDDNSFDSGGSAKRWANVYGVNGVFGEIQTDTITEKTTDAGVTVDGVLLKDNVVQADTITEKTADAGVTIEGTLLKDGKIQLKTPTELTLDSAGAITVTQSYHTVDTYGDASTDDLTTINGGVAGQILILRVSNDDRTVVVKNNVVIALDNGTDFSLNASTKTIMLMYTTMWVELSRSDNT